MKLHFASLLLCCFIISCVDPYHHRKEPLTEVSLDYKLLSSSPLFKNNIRLELDTADHYLHVRIGCEGLKHFPFPVDKHDTLSNTAFRFIFYYNGQPLRTDYTSLQRSAWDIDSTADADVLSISSDTMDLATARDFSFRIPMYAFHGLKKGKQTLEMSVSQDVFTGSGNRKDKDGDHFVNLYAKRSLLNAHIRFDLTIPPVYKSMLYGYGLELRNDSTPAGMDNTIWNSSYPDLYWMVYYPVDEYYTKTLYEKSTDRYTARDTFCLYHYYANDSIGIGVYDHDYLSADDGLGYWTGPLERLQRHTVNRISFGYVKSFDVKVQPGIIVN